MVLALPACSAANGAGKSTLIKLASGQLHTDLGSVSIGEHDAWSAAAKRQLGYCPDVNTLYEEMTGREFVTAMTALYGYPHREVRERAEAALEAVGMSDLASRSLGGCSHGIRQRIKLAQALVNDPQILLLDEPLLGIDPGGRHAINDLLTRLADRGKTILVSSHILEEIEQLADVIVMIAHGRLVASGTLAEVRNLLEDRPLTIEIGSDEARRLAALVISSPVVRHVEVAGEILHVQTASPARFFQWINEIAVRERIEIRRLVTLDAGADAVFNYLGQGVA